MSAKDTAESNATKADVIERSVSRGSNKEATSLKRGREGSLEPTAVEPATPLTTKKNRLGSASSGAPAAIDELPDSSPVVDSAPAFPDAEDETEAKKDDAVDVDPDLIDERAPDEADVGGDDDERDEANGEPVQKVNASEARNVGEVRRKVEKMTYEEGAGVGASVSRIERVDDRMEVGKEEDWEKIDKEEVEAEGEYTDTEEKPSAEGEGKERKRKALDRSQSSYAPEDEAAAGVKRQKETPSPPPDDGGMPIVPESAAPLATLSQLPESERGSTDAAPPPVVPKKPQASFSAFSSTASPFAARSSASPFAAAASASSSTFGAGTPSKPMSSGFGTYSATFSPFGSKKPAIPAGSSALASAASDPSDVTGEKSEAGPSTREATDPAGASGGKSSFGDILSATGKGDEAEGEKLQMTEQDIHTGEEDEETIYQSRVKLYVMQADGGWRERGTGTLKLNVRRSDGKGARLVMRAEGVLRLVLNVALYVGMTCLEDGKHVRTTVFEESERKFITFRTGSNKSASELAQNIHDLIPLERTSVSKSPDPAGLA